MNIYKTKNFNRTKLDKYQLYRQKTIWGFGDLHLFTVKSNHVKVKQSDMVTNEHQSLL